jgi:nucleoside-diphosphate-sugar epimerase
MKIAITGSRGFIGRALKKRLIDLNHEVIEIDFELGFDLTDWENVKNVKDFKVLIHLAAKSYVPDSFVKPKDFYNTNILATLNALELCRNNNAKIIYTSSYVYGEPQYLPIDELHSTMAFNPYAQSKLIGEDLCKGYHRDFDVPVTIFRPFNIYGKGQNENFLIPSIIKQALKGEVLLKDPRPKRDFVNIEDVVEAYIKAIEVNFDLVETFNLGSGVSTSIKELLKIISLKVGKEISINFTNEYRKNEVFETLADISKANRFLMWQPKISIDEGISDIFK